MYLRLNNMKKISVKSLDGVEMFSNIAEDHTAWLDYCLNNNVFGDPATYTIETIDLNQDYDFLLEQCYKNRQAEYPSVTDQLDALFHARQGDMSALEALDAQKAAVKAKYPKPIKEQPAVDQPVKES
jgi:hypothetical protein